LFVVAKLHKQGTLNNLPLRISVYGSGARDVFSCVNRTGQSVTIASTQSSDPSVTPRQSTVSRVDAVARQSTTQAVSCWAARSMGADDSTSVADAR